MVVLRKRACWRFLLLFLLLPLMQAALAAEATPDADEYQPGRGLRLGDSGWRLGGYASAGYLDLRDEGSAFVVDNLSLLMRWEGEGRWRLFSELDLEDAFRYEPGRGRISSRSYLALERLYADYLHSTALNYRLGKFLTPIGRWNVIHADPLVWTTSRPLVTQRSFPTNATGVMLFGAAQLGGRTVDYSIYGAVGRDWRPDPELDPFKEAYGLHTSVALSANTSLGLSLASFEQVGAEGERRKLVGFDYVWERDRYEISAELAYRFSDLDDSFDERGAFVQAVAPLSERLYAVARYEYFKPAGPDTETHLWLAGVAYKFAPNWVLKAEYQDTTRQQALASNGLLTSISVLF